MQANYKMIASEDPNGTMTKAKVIVSGAIMMGGHVMNSLYVPGLGLPYLAYMFCANSTTLIKIGAFCRYVHLNLAWYLLKLNPQFS
jgi:hypothetical protein